MSAVPNTPVVPGVWHPSLPDAAECRRRLDGLQARQRQIVELYAMGWAAKEIGAELGVTQKTVYNNMNQVAVRLDVRPPIPAVVALYWRAQQAESVVEAEPVSVSEVVEWRPRSTLELSAAELSAIRRAG